MVMWSALPQKALEDCFRPPAEPVMVRCLHCHGEYWSSEIVWVPEGDDGFWRCPIYDCGAAGFQFDIFPFDSPLWDGEEEDEEDDWQDDDEGLANDYPPDV